MLEEEKLKQKDVLLGKLQQLPKVHLLELMKSLNIELRFKDKKKANKEKIISHILEAIKNETLTIERVEKELEQEKYKKPVPRRLTKEDLDNFGEKMFWRIEQLREEILSLKKSIQELQTEMDDGLLIEIKSLKELVDVSAEKNSLSSLLKIMRELNLDFQTPEDFDESVHELLKRGIKLSMFLKVSDLITKTLEIRDILRKLKWPEDLELFYDTLKKEFEKIGLPVPIYQMKRAVTEHLGISGEEFEKQLTKCFKKGWLTLDLRSPIEEKNIEFIEVDGRKYYIISSLKR